MACEYPFFGGTEQPQKALKSLGNGFAEWLTI
jgi:hypothetical protein